MRIVFILLALWFGFVHGIIAHAQTITTEQEEMYHVSESTDSVTLKQRGVRLLEQGLYQEAIEIYQRLRQLDSSDTTYTKKLVIAYHAYALEEMRALNYLEALFYLKEAYALAEDTAIIGKSMSAAYYKFAEQQFNAGKVDEACTSYRKAIEFDPMNVAYLGRLGFVLYESGVKFYNEKKYEQAERCLKDALLYRSDNTYIYEVLGEIAYFRQDLEKAKVFWQKALQGKGIKEEHIPEIENKIKKLETEMGHEKDLASYEAAQFIIRYDKKGVAQSGYQLREILRRAYRVIGRDLNYFSKTKTPVIIYNHDIFMEQTANTGEGDAEGVGGHGSIRAMYDGKIRLPAIDTKTNLKTFESLVRHEYTHALIYEIAGDKCPLWLNEGLAQYEENKIVKIDTSIVTDAVRNNEQILFDSIFSSPTMPAGTNTSLFYKQSFTMVQYLLKRYQMYKIKKFLEDLKKGKNFKQAFYDQLRLKPEQFDKKWVRFIREGKA
ncbi:MAG: tetratricopeptide repeat protein [Candidatus Omnitrophica bacterium]|nr:tetratricopeptide repeat protein [Candidatus Omnitrophota bacterium]